MSGYFCSTSAFHFTSLHEPADVDWVWVWAETVKTADAAMPRQ
jgi:hypothetical protein